MHRILLAHIIFILALTNILTVSAQDTQYVTHTVQAGQGLYSISRMYGVTEADIINLNPGSEKVIKAGEQLIIPVRKSGNANVHLVKPGETLYSLAKTYGTTVHELTVLNPEIATNGLKAGQQLKIPGTSAPSAESSVPEMQQQVSGNNDNAGSITEAFATTHIVKKKETIYKISRKYKISQTELLEANPQLRYSKLQAGSVINIPYPKTKDREPVITSPFPAADSSAISRIKEYTDTIISDIIKKDEPHALEVALMMPFELSEPQSTNQHKMVEFYQGVLLATEDLRRDGISLNLHVYDTDNDRHSIGDILSKEEMGRMDIIFGPRYASHIAEATVFAAANRIPIVLPISSTVESIDHNPYIYQLNTPQSQMASNVCKYFLRQFKNPKVIFIEADGDVRNPLVDKLQDALSNAGKPYQTFKINFEDSEIGQRLAETLSADSQNIFMLTSSSNGQLASVLPIIQLATRAKGDGIETHLFGYPEYQAYAMDHMDELFEVDTWFYSWFFTNNKLPEAVKFDYNFRHAFGRQLMQSYPNYAAYGYDMALFFLKGISQYGSQLPDHINDIHIKPVQMGFRFNREGSSGGFINHKVFFVHLSNKYTVEKIEFD